MLPRGPDHALLVNVTARKSGKGSRVRIQPRVRTHRTVTATLCKSLASALNVHVNAVPISQGSAVSIASMPVHLSRFKLLKTNQLRRCVKDY